MKAVSLICPQCGAAYVRPAWRARQAARNGTRMTCSYPCAHAARRVHTPESKAEWHREYRAKNRAWINEKQKAARAGPNRAHFVEQSRATYRKHIEKNRERARDYASRHRSEAAERLTNWKRDNPERDHWHRTRGNMAVQMGVKPRMVPDHLVDARVEFLALRRAILDAKASAPV